MWRGNVEADERILRPLLVERIAELQSRSSGMGNTYKVRHSQFPTPIKDSAASWVHRTLRRAVHANKGESDGGDAVVRYSCLESTSSNR